MLRFNFAEVKEPLISKLVKPDLLLAVLVALIVILAFFFVESSVKEKLQRTEERIAKLEAEKRRLLAIQRKEKELLKKRRRLQEKLKIVSSLDRGREVPKPLYFFADPEAVKDVWLDNLSLKSAKVKVKGNIWSVKKFPDFLEKVEERIGRVLFKETERAEYRNDKINFRTTYYKFEFEAERSNGISK